MNMSEDVAGATVQLTMKAAETGAHLLEKSMDLIAKLLQMIANKKAEKQAKSPVKSTDLTDIKPGTVSMKSLVKSCRASGDGVCTSEQSVTKEDVKYIAKKAREYGIPVSFTGSKCKDNLYANVRKSDAEIFKNICTEMMKNKIEERPQELGNFKVQDWEIPFLTAELNQHDLSAMFGKTKDGEAFCLYEKSDEKAIHIAREHFVQKCAEIEKEIEISKDENGYFTIKNNFSGDAVTFQDIPSRSELSDRIQAEFGYHSGKADIVCAKFGQEMLSGTKKAEYFSNDPQKEFTKIDANIELKGENILTKPYPCWRLTPKTDGIPKIVFQSEEGAFCALNPEKMTRKKMSEKLKNELHIDDENTVNALVDKAVRVNEYYQKQNQKYFSVQREFAMEQDENGEITLKDFRSGQEKSLQTIAITADIRRTDKYHFTVKSKDFPELYLSFSKKKSSLQQLKELYQGQGVPEETAHQMANETFRNAQAQSAEQVLTIEEIKLKAESAVLLTVRFGTDTKEFDISDRGKALTEIGDYFHVSQICAKSLMELAEEKIHDVHQDIKIHGIPPVIPEQKNPIPPPPSRGAR